MTFQGTQNDAKVHLRDPAPQDFCCYTTRLTQTGRGLTRLAQTGRGFECAPARRPGRRGVGGRRHPPFVSKCSSTPDQRVGGFLNDLSMAFSMDFEPKSDPKGEGWWTLLAPNSSLFRSCSAKGVLGGALSHFGTLLTPC